jgi:putative DNA primase/helicase
MNDYGTAPDSGTFMRKQNPGIPNDIAALAGKRFIWASETLTGQTANEALIKKMVSDEPMSARFLHGEFFTFTPVGKIWLGTNDDPKVNDTSDAIWERIKKIAFLRQWKLHPGERETEFLRIPDRNLKFKLQQEASGILNWLIQGCLVYLKEGLLDPAPVVAATNEYRNSQDSLSCFIDECCIKDSTASVFAAEFNKSFVSWCKENNQKAMTANFVGKELVRLGFKKERESTGSRLAYYWGIKLAGKPNLENVSQNLPFDSDFSDFGGNFEN